MVARPTVYAGMGKFEPPQTEGMSNYQSMIEKFYHSGATSVKNQNKVPGGAPPKSKQALKQIKIGIEEDHLDYDAYGDPDLFVREDIQIFPKTSKD